MNEHGDSITTERTTDGDPSVTEPTRANGSPRPHRERTIFDADATEFSAKFGRLPFALKHRLAHHPLFSTSKLATVAEMLLKTGRGFRFVNRDAQGNLDARFADIPDRKKVLTAFDNLERSNSWIKLNNVGDADPEYIALTRDAVREIEKLSGQSIQRRVTVAQLTVFMSSPHSVTPYHFDHESNFLCQIQGEKEACVFDPADRDLVPHQAIERFYCGDLNSIKYSDRLEPRGHLFELTPGVGIHHPPLAPHWVKNGKSVSVSVSINLCLSDIDRRAHVYQINHFLRKAGLNPAPPGKYPTTDRVKGALFGWLGTSNPKSSNDAVASGLNRLRMPLYAARRMLSTPKTFEQQS